MVVYMNDPISVLYTALAPKYKLLTPNDLLVLPSIKKLIMIEKEMVIINTFKIIQSTCMFSRELIHLICPSLIIHCILNQGIMIRVYLLTTKVSTISDLSCYLSEQAQITTFEACNLGKLIRHPFVAQHFKINKNITQTDQFTTSEVFKMYLEFLRLNQGPVNGKGGQTKGFYTQQRFYNVI